jgi:hypothetical protein
MCFIIYLHLKKDLYNNCFGVDMWILNGMFKVNAWERNKPWKCLRIQRGLHVMMYTKNSNNLTIFSTYLSLMHHDGNLKNNFHSNFVINDGLCPNLALCCEINAHMNDIIVQQNIILICKTLKHLYNSNKKTKKYYIEWFFFMKFYTYKKKT